MNQQIAAHLGSIVRLAREQMSLTQVQVAERVGLNSVVYSRIERGLMIPSVETMKKLCVELMVSPEDLLGLTESSGGAARARPEDDTNLRRLIFVARTLDAGQVEALLRVATEFAR